MLAASRASVPGSAAASTSQPRTPSAPGIPGGARGTSRWYAVSSGARSGSGATSGGSARGRPPHGEPPGSATPAPSAAAGQREMTVVDTRRPRAASTLLTPTCCRPAPSRGCGRRDAASRRGSAAHGAGPRDVAVRSPPAGAAARTPAAAARRTATAHRHPRASAAAEPDRGIVFTLLGSRVARCSPAAAARCPDARARTPAPRRQPAGRERRRVQRRLAAAPVMAQRLGAEPKQVEPSWIRDQAAVPVWSRSARQAANSRTPGGTLRP